MKAYPYQIKGAEFLIKHQRTAYLADYMGLGKTIQAITAAGRLRVGVVGVVCPASMTGVWEEEFRMWGCHAIGLRIESYNMLARSSQAMWDTQPDILICDEAHYLKTPGRQRTEATLDLARKLGCRTWFLSGTPTPNGPHELFPIMQYAMPKTLKHLGLEDPYDWRQHFCKWYMADWGPQVTGAKNIPELKRLLYGSGFMLRRKFEDVELELPQVDIRQMRLKVKLDKDVQETLAEVSDKTRNLIERGVLPKDDVHLATARRLLGAVKAFHTARIISDQLQDNDQKLVVFAYHREALNILEKHLEKFGVVRIDGSTPQKRRTALVKQFQTDPQTRVFLGQVDACKEGITLTASAEAIIVEPSWVPDYNQQAIGRIRRIGQTRKRVTAQFVTLAGTLDDQIMRVLVRKQKTLATTID